MKRRLLALTILTAVISACTSAQFSEQNGTSRNISVIVSLPETKVALSSNHEKWIWETGDQIGMLNDIDNSSLSITPSQDPQIVSVPSGSSTVYGIIPFDSKLSSGPSSVYVNIPGEQKQAKAGVLANTRMPMASKATISGGSAELTFHNLAAALALNIYKSEGFDSNEKVLSVTVTPKANTGFAGAASVNLNNKIEYSGGDWAGKSVRVVLDSACAVGNGKPADTKAYGNQIYLLLGRQDYIGFDFTVNTNNAKYTISSSAVFDCKTYDFIITNINLSNCTASIDIENSAESFHYQSLLAATVGLDNPILMDVGTLTEDIIPDFSRVGYKCGDEPIPTLPVVRTLTEQSVWENTIAGGGTYADSTAYLQAVIDEVGASGGGAILFKDGKYTFSRTLFLDANNIVLRGESREGTILYGAGTRGWTMINIGTSVKTATGEKQFLWNGRAVTLSSFPAPGKGKPFGEYTFYYYTPLGPGRTLGDYTQIIEDYVPVGRFYVEVKDASLFNIGDDVLIYRPHSNEWISDIGMDKTASNGYTRSVTYNSPVSYWTKENWNITHTRKVTAILGKRVYFDNPVVQSLDKNYGGGKLYKVTRQRVSGCGVENLSLDSYFDPQWTQTGYLVAGGTITQYCDEDHVWEGIMIKSAENCWVRKVNSKHIGESLVYLTGGARYITIEDCHTYEPASYISGNRRYAFLLTGEAELILIKDCSTDLDRHSFAMSARTFGPNVFLNCTCTRNFDGPEPHHRWSTGGLYDNLTCLDTHLYLRDRGNSGNGHGWAGANFVLWNCNCYTIECDNVWSKENTPQIETHPKGYKFHSDRPSMHNYAIGCVGTKKINTYKYNSPYFSDDGYQEDYYKDVLGLTSRPDGIWYPQREAESKGSASDRINLNNVPADAAAKSWWPKMSGAVSSFSNPESLYLSQLEDRHARGIYLNYIF